LTKSTGYDHEGDKLWGGSNDSEGTVYSKPRECFVDKRSLPWRLIPEQSLKKVAVSHNRPLWVCNRIGKHIMQIPYGPNFSSRERLSLLSQVDKLTNAVGQCERIHQTTVPLNYARHSLRSLTLWLFTLPFTLVQDLGLMTAPVTACIAWVLFGVYQIGYSIEDPFQGTLRLSILCDAIRRDVIGDDLESLDNDGYYSGMGDASWQESGDFTNQLAETNSQKLYQHLPLIANEESFSQPMPKLLVQENGTLNIVGLIEGT
jgi:hypothetical protein